MDSGLEKIINESLEEQDAVGVLVTDESGLCILAKGQANPSASGYLASIGNRVKEIGEFHHKDNEDPVVCLQLNNSKVLIKNQKNFTIATYYNN